MSRSGKQKAREAARTDGRGEPPKNDEKSNLAVGGWEEERPPVWRDFPGPRGVDIPLRVALEREAYADLSAHAKESLDREVCGALAGDVCEDAEGPYVHVKAAIRGAAVKAGGAHVTYTQETWTAIHETLERRYPRLTIVGWYHSHPGFGVEFSDMDLFIQKNFFPGKTQVAFVTDPLGGDEALCVNADGGPRYLDRFWVDGRERRLRAPASAEAGAGGGDRSPASRAALDKIETRLTQVSQTLESLQTWIFRILTFTAMVVCAGVIVFIVSNLIASVYREPVQPPELSEKWYPLPLEFGGKEAYVSIKAVEWKVPPELHATYVRDFEKQLKAAAETIMALEAELQEYRAAAGVTGPPAATGKTGAGRPAAGTGKGAGAPAATGGAPAAGQQREGERP